MKRRLLSLILCVAMLLSMLTVCILPASAEGYWGNCWTNVTWNFDETSGTLTIFSADVAEGWEWESCPWGKYLEDIKTAVIKEGVTAIGDYAFYGCDGLTGITIPDSVTHIGDFAFWYCTELSEITIPDSVTSIGIGAFHTCLSLTDINIPNGVTVISSYAFIRCQALKNIVIPDGVTSIGKCAFYASNSLTDITIPDSVTTIGDDAFYNCTGLTSITIPDSVTAIGGWAFAGCSALTNVFYKGTEEQAAKIEIGDKNDPLKNANWFYKTEVVIDNPFTDVKKGKFYYDAVLWAVNNDVTTGVSDNSFAPDNKCTRGQIVTFLWRAAGSPKASTTNTAFTDIKEGSYYYDAVIWAVENGITSGTTATTFSPNSTCTRGQIVTFLWRAKGEQKATISNPFKDTTDGAFYTDAMLWAVENDITTGTSATTFSPNNACTRGQCVTFLYRSFC